MVCHRVVDAEHSRGAGSENCSGLRLRAIALVPPDLLSSGAAACACASHLLATTVRIRHLPSHLPNTAPHGPPVIHGALPAPAAFRAHVVHFDRALRASPLFTPRPLSKLPFVDLTRFEGLSADAQMPEVVHCTDAASRKGQTVASAVSVLPKRHQSGRAFRFNARRGIGGSLLPSRLLVYPPLPPRFLFRASMCGISIRPTLPPQLTNQIA